jgi:hypothetical protein
VAGAALLFDMPYVPIFTYGGGSNPQIDYPRLLISDTQEFLPDGVTPGYIFSDQEIQANALIIAGVWQSSMFYTQPTGLSNLPSTPTNYLRQAAQLLFSLAANKSRLASVKQLLDVKLDSSDAAIQLRETAQSYLDLDDNSGAFVIIEQVNNNFSFQDRFWKQVQRQQGVGF